MKAVTVIALVVILSFFSFPPAKAQNASEETLPEGMEAVQIGPSEVIVPKGAKVVKKGGLITVESTNEYVARQIASMDERIKNIESQLEAIRKEISEIKEILAGQKKAAPASPEGPAK